MFIVPHLKRVIQYEEVFVPCVYVAKMVHKRLAFPFAFNLVPEFPGLSPFPYPMSGEHLTEVLWTDSYNGMVSDGHVYP